MEQDLLERLSWTIGDRLAKAREVANVTSQEMADELDVSRHTISNYEHGRTTPSKAVLVVWSQRCNVPLDWLLGNFGRYAMPPELISAA